MKRLLAVFALVCFISGCGGDDENAPYDNPDIDDIQAEVKLTRIDLKLLTIDNKEGAIKMLDENPLLRTEYLRPFPQFQQDEQIYKLATDEKIKGVIQDRQRIFGDMANINEELTKAFKRLRFYYPECVVPEVFTVVTGFGTDFFVGDSSVVVGLDFFPDQDSKYRSQEYHEYMLAHMTPAHFSSKVLFYFSQNYVQGDWEDETVLNEMIAHGRTYYFVKQLLPELPDSVIIGYSSTQMAFCTKFESQIWDHLLQKQILYSTKDDHKRRYVRLAPFVNEIDKRCPGRIGQWVGWQIVERYMKENPDVSFKDLMKADKAKDILIKSKYRPTKKQ